MNWVSRRKEVAGILSPDIQGRRKLYDISNDRFYDLELEGGPADNAGTLSIGRFIFDKDVFETGRQILREAALKQPAVLIVDEVGKLELEHQQGFEPELSGLINRYKESKDGGILILVVRDTLLTQAIIHHGLEEAHIVSSIDQLP